jgi:glycerate-2-kinase
MYRLPRWLLENTGPSEVAEADTDWSSNNTYHVFAQRDLCAAPGEPPAHIFTGPTGTNVNDLLIAWRVR